MQDPPKGNPFFIAYMAELMSEKSPTSLSLKKATDANRGTTSARLQKIRLALKVENVGDISFLYPESVYADPLKKIEHLPVYLNMYGTGRDEWLSDFVSCFKTISNKFLETIYNSHKIVDYLNIKVNVCEALRGLHRTKMKKVKGRQVSVTITPNRPSARVEILSDEERMYLKAVEGKFTAYENKLAEYKEGCKLLDIGKVRLSLKRLIDQQWELISKISPVLAPRTKALSSLAKMYLKKADISKQVIADICARITMDASDVDLKLIRALHIFELANKIATIKGDLAQAYGTFSFREGKLECELISCSPGQAKLILGDLQMLGIDTSTYDIMKVQSSASKSKKKETSKPKSERKEKPGSGTKQTSSSEDSDKGDE